MWDVRCYPKAVAKLNFGSYNAITSNIVHRCMMLPEAVVKLYFGSYNVITSNIVHR